MPKVLMQVVGPAYDQFVEVELLLLVELFRIPDMPERTERFWVLTTPAFVQSTKDVEFTLVLDGVEDENSWLELQDELRSQDPYQVERL